MFSKAVFIVLLSISSSFLGAQCAPAAEAEPCDPGTTTSTSSTTTATGIIAAKGGKGGKDAQTSLTLDPRVIAKGFANDGQSVPEAGQVASLTSTNNFINFCLTVPNLPITDGKQIKTGSCDPAPMGVIPSSKKMPSSKFQFPQNFGTIEANTPFTIKMAINNLATGNFVNAQENYYAAPQTLDGSGVIKGHSHVVVELIDSLKSKAPTDPTKFAFFKGLNSQAVGGILTADVTTGLPAGVYRLASINSAANHQPALVPIAQHGCLEDAVYFTVKDNGSSPPASSSSAPAVLAGATSSAAPAAQTPAQNGGGTKSKAPSQFGKCPTPGIQFGKGFGVMGTSFRPTHLGSFPIKASKNIESVANGICARLASKMHCNAPAAAVAKCRSAAGAAARAAHKAMGKDGRAADAFNAVFGEKTNFAMVKSQSR